MNEAAATISGRKEVYLRLPFFIGGGRIGADPDY
jgi:hypothetical protein